MNKLERFFRTVYDQSPPPGATEPLPGGWEAVQRRLEPKRPAKRNSIILWFCIFLFFALLGFLFFDHDSAPDPPASGVPVAANGQLPLPRDSSRREPAVAPYPGGEAPDLESLPVPAPTPVPRQVPPVAVLSLPRPANVVSVRKEITSPILPGTEEEMSANVPDTDRKLTPVPTLPVVPPAFVASQGAGVQADLSTLETSPLVVKEPWRFEPTPHWKPGPAVWEVSARMLPWQIKTRGYYERLSTTPGTGDYQAFTQRNGPPLILYSTANQEGFISDRQLGIGMAGIEIARRFPSGFRLSLGTVYSHEAGRINNFGPEYAGEIESGEYLLLHSNTEDWHAHWITVGVQYTINRRHRFRVNVGLQGLGQVYERYGGRSFLVGGEPLSVQPVSSLVTKNRNIFSWVLPMPQLTFEYQLRSNWSLSAGIGGMTGVGATYRLP